VRDGPCHLPAVPPCFRIHTPVDSALWHLPVTVGAGAAYWQVVGRASTYDLVFGARLRSDGPPAAPAGLHHPPARWQAPIRRSASPSSPRGLTCYHAAHSGAMYAGRGTIRTEMATLIYLDNAATTRPHPSVVDAMAYETPLLTTRSPDHGPEIGYLDPGENGWMTDCLSEDYAAAINHLLSDADLRMRLVEGCRRTASRITLGNMVERFRWGVVSALEMAPRSGFCKTETAVGERPDQQEC